MERLFPGLLATALVLCVAVVPLATSAQAGAAPQSGPADARFPAQQTESTGTGPTANNETAVGTDGVLLDVTVYENGSAAWHVEYRTRLDDSGDRATFRRLERDLTNDSTAASNGFYDRIRGTIAAAEETTGREMAGTNFDVRTTVRRIPRQYGVVVYSFRWDGFATQTDQGLQAGDALAGFFLSSGERLVVSWPEGYELDAVEPSPDEQRDRTVVWRGPTTFGSTGPNVQLTERAWPTAGVATLGLAVAVALAAAVWTRRERLDGDLATLRTRLFEDEDDESTLLSNEERVIRLLRERGGRVKQQEVADELGWTETKTSYVVSNLREEQWIRSFRIGRENVLSLADSMEGQQSET